MFALSKIVGALAEPGNAALIGLLLGVVLLHTSGWRTGRRLLAIVAAALVAIAMLPWHAWLVAPLENRFPAPDPMPARIDGIVVLGGAVDPGVSDARRQPSLNGAVERITVMVELARTHPEAKLVFSGGSGAITNQELREAPVARDFLGRIGFDADRVAFEADSRNTRENATRTRELMAPKADETWLLVTSALHMPRAVGTFRAAGWSVVPYPVDYTTSGREPPLGFSLGGGLSALNAVLHEGLGMAYYRLRGWSDRLYPGPLD